MGDGLSKDEIDELRLSKRITDGMYLKTARELDPNTDVGALYASIPSNNADNRSPRKTYRFEKREKRIFLLVYVESTRAYRERVRINASNAAIADRLRSNREKLNGALRDSVTGERLNLARNKS
jgi:hypothetical protein